MSSFPASEKANRMHASSTMKAAQQAAKLRAEGYDVIDLTVGEPDFDTPDFIKQYAWDGLQKGLTKYTPSSGMKSFHEAVAHFYKEEFGADVKPSEIVATCGGKQALFNAITTLVGEGDEVLIVKPYWVTFPEIVNFAGATNVYIETEETDFILTAEQVERTITDRTKLLVVNSPSNPSGRVIPKEEMIKIIELCASKEVYVITDECYLFFAYPPAEVFSAAVLSEEVRKYVCIAGSFSKTFAMTGWRIGYTIAPEAWSKEMSKLQSHSTSHPTSFVQYACARALENRAETMAAVKEMLAEYEARRNWLIPALNEIKGFKVAEPEGAFYAFIDVRELLGGKFQKSADVADALLTEAQVVLTDGEGFGAEGFLRFSYATSMENLHKAVDRIKKVFEPQSENHANA